MAFATQFALSVELTKLIPMAVTAAEMSCEAVMKLARDLQNSGSDIVVEEDLIELFGRTLIDSKIDSSFRIVMAQPSSLTSGRGDFFLHSGAGPTIVRALTNSHYYSTIVQCSFLLTEHESSSLAAMIVAHCNAIAQDAPNDIRRAAPNSNALSRSLRAIEEQSEAYKWHEHLRAVAVELDMDNGAIHHTIPDPIVRGLLLMMPMVQRFPDRLIHIETCSGLCNIIVWAHTILGMTVAVSLSAPGREDRHVRFPPGNIDGSEQIFIVCNEAFNHHIWLMDRSQDASGYRPTQLSNPTSSPPKEKLFELKSQEDDKLPESTLKGPACGYAARVVKSGLPRDAYTERLLKELSIIAGAFSVCIARHLVRNVSVPAEHSPNQRDEQEETRKVLPHEVSTNRILDAWSLLFDTGADVNQKIMMEYADSFAGISLSTLEAPAVVATILQSQQHCDEGSGQNFAACSFESAY